MAIWHRSCTLEELNEAVQGNLCGLLGIIFTEIGSDSLTAEMPVDERTRQPAGLLHGGASAVLAETVGSFASHLCLDPEIYYAVGQQVSASHLRPVRSGKVTGKAVPLHLGRRNHLWDISITNSAGQLCCSARLTTAILSRR